MLHSGSLSNGFFFEWKHLSPGMVECARGANAPNAPLMWDVRGQKRCRPFRPDLLFADANPGLRSLTRSSPGYHMTGLRPCLKDRRDEGKPEP